MVERALRQLRGAGNVFQRRRAIAEALAAAGVRRISVGCAPLQTLLAQARTLASLSSRADGTRPLRWGCSLLATFLDVAGGVLFGIVAARVGRAATAPLALPGAVLAAGMNAVVALVGATSFFFKSFPAALSHALTVGWYVASAASLALAAYLGVVSGRIALERWSTVSDTSPLDPAFRRVADGIGLYMLATAARIAFAVLSMLVVSGGGDASLHDLHNLKDNVLLLTSFGAGAAVFMIAGVFMISRGPIGSVAKARAFSVIAAMGVGFLLDGATAWILSDALDGSVSAALFAMDAIPVLAGLGTSLGVIGGYMLCTTLAGIAELLEIVDTARRAKGASIAVVGGGAAGALLELTAKHLPFELFVFGAALAIPTVCFAAIQLLRVMFAVSSSIRARV